jgi:hypothetical protein
MCPSLNPVFAVKPESEPINLAIGLEVIVQQRCPKRSDLTHRRKGHEITVALTPVQYYCNWLDLLCSHCSCNRDNDKDVAAIEKYNEEDLEATWAVFQWLRAKVA